MATKSYKREHGLTAKQLVAIDCLLMGKTDREAAEVAGVNRVTITKWRLYDPYFQAELNRRRAEIWNAAVDRLRNLILKALDVVEKSLDQGDVKTALEIVKMSGLDMTKPGGDLGTYGIGPTEAEEIVEELVTAEKRKAWLKPIYAPSEREKMDFWSRLEELAQELQKLQNGA